MLNLYKKAIEDGGVGAVPKNVSSMQFYQNINGFSQHDSQGFYNSYNSIYKTH